MKILKIRVRSDAKGTMLYPPGFMDIRCLESIYCDDVGANICWLVVAVEDKDVDKITDLKDVTELTTIEAGTFLEKYDPHDTEITDEGMVRAIEIKSQLGTALSATELKAIDPNDPTPGIQYRKRFVDKISERAVGEISHL
jgi:hypothetical protein